MLKKVLTFILTFLTVHSEVKKNSVSSAYIFKYLGISFREQRITKNVQYFTFFIGFKDVIRVHSSTLQNYWFKILFYFILLYLFYH